jgi:glycosyltransferase involved in cell wall biosynthesis
MESHLRILCNELRRLAEVRVIAANDQLTTIDEHVDGIPVSRVGTIFTLASAPVCPSMASRIGTSEADLIHIHLPNPTAILAYFGSGHPGSLVATYHSDTIRHQFLAAFFEPILHAALRRCAAIIVTSPNYLRTSKVLSSHKDRCEVIPFGIRVEDFNLTDVTVVERLRQQYGDRIVLSVGRLVYYKGFESLIHAMSNVRGCLLIAGDGPDREKLQKLSVALGLAERVIFLGEVQNEMLVSLYHAANVFVLASIARSEAFGIVQLEAMACGKPIVNTSIASGVPFVSLNGVTGFTVPPADSLALADAINCLLENSALCAQFGEAARHRVRNEFSLELMVKRVYRLYQGVLRSSNGHRSYGFTAKTDVSETRSL